MTTKQIKLAEALDDALFWMGRSPSFEESHTSRLLRNALRSALRLSPACRGEIPWADFLAACRLALGDPADWAGTELQAAYQDILLHITQPKEQHEAD